MPHSPGPWQAEAPPAEAYLDPDIALSEEVRFWIVDEGRASEVLAEVTVTMHGNAEANARVMAAAPELLAAVKALLHDIDTGLLVRDVRRDCEPGWTENMLAFVQRLQAAQRAVLKAEEGQ